MALSRMGFLPSFVLKRNKLRGSPHYSIALATGIPIAVLLLVNGRIDLLGDMYAFGLLGAFSLTCLGLDIVRARDWRKARLAPQDELVREQTRISGALDDGHAAAAAGITSADDLQVSMPVSRIDSGALSNGVVAVEASAQEVKGLWFKNRLLPGRADYGTGNSLPGLPTCIPSNWQPSLVEASPF